MDPSLAVALGTTVLSEVLGSRDRKRQRQQEQFATELEADRRRQIQNAIGAIDFAFDAPTRERQYQDYANALRTYYSQELDRQKADTDRATRFALARSGLVGGSADVDTRSRINEQYLRGVLDAERAVQGSVADLRGADEQARLNMIQLAQSGMDASTAAQRAAEVMQSNIAGALPRAQAQGLGDVFADSIDMARRTREEQERRRALGHRADIYGAGGL